MGIIFATESEKWLVIVMQVFDVPYLRWDLAVKSTCRLSRGGLGRTYNTQQCLPLLP